MPLFLSDEEYQRCSNDAGLLVEKADAFIQDLYVKLETVNAQVDAASITAEQTCSFIEQKYVFLSEEYAKLESENARLVAEVEKEVSQLSQVQAEKHRLHLNSIGRDGEFERLMAEVSEHQKAKRQMMELVEQKESEISEKNALIKTYLDKIVSLTENAALREGKLNDLETELQRSKAIYNRISQEKELIERHNMWLNDELTAKVNNLNEIRSRHSELEAEMALKLSDVERHCGECSKSLTWHKERVNLLETKLGSLEEELLLSKASAANDEERFAAEIGTANKLVALYKERSEELAKKAGELEGVIKALETHLSQVENDYRERIEKEISAKTELENATTALKEKLEKSEAELEAARKKSDLTLQLGDFTTNMCLGSFENSNIREETQMLVPTVPAGISGTALAASLLRDGWSLTKMYCKYQEAVDALRHEQLGRKNVESLMQRILHEIEAKAEAILDERAEHERILDAYSLINEKLQQSLSEKSNLEKTIRGLQAELRRNERDYASAQNDIADLQKQVTLLLKECIDVQLRCGIDVSSNLIITDIEVNNDPEAATSDEHPTFNDINGLVEQNVKLRSLVRKFSEEVENREIELKEKFEVEIKRHTEEAASRINAVLQRAQEQAQMIESLHTSVAMYKKLYEEEQKWRLSPNQASPDPDRTINEVAKMFQGSHVTSPLPLEPSNGRAKQLEEELAKTRIELLSTRNQRDKLALEANFARERLESFMKELELKREESNRILARNIEFSQIIVDYQKKIRDSSDAVHAAEDLSRQLTMEVSVLKHENEMLSNAEKRACEEVRSLSGRVHRLQASLDTIHSTEEVREEARILELKKKEEHIKKIEREWAEVKKELQEERDNSRTLTLAREDGVNTAMRQVEEIGKQLSDALHAVSAAEARAAVAEARYQDLEKRIRSSENMAVVISGGDHTAYSSEITIDTQSVKEKIAKLGEELQNTKDHMMQYKSIAQVNEAALKQIEAAHEEYKTEAEKLKCLQEAEISALREKICQFQNESILMSKEVASASRDKDEALESANAEITRFKHECAAKTFDYEEMKVRVVALKEDLEREHHRWAAAQGNYERQVILQSETIQELTKTSKALSLLQDEASELRRVLAAAKSKNSELKREWEAERVVLEQMKNDAEKKYNEVNEQNKILHSRLEALDIQLAERGHSSSRTAMENSTLNAADESGMQSVVNYLRRSKEIAETEISLLKQEKLRLQSQLKSALSASEAAKASLQAERSSSRAMLLTEDEIKSLQLQVTEMSLLRESNMQLREENKHNFEECQKLREAAQKSLTDVVHLQSLLREKESEIEACRKEIEALVIENDLLRKKNTELLQNFQDIDVNEYNRMKEEVNKMLAHNYLQLEESKKLLGEKQEQISRLEKELANSTAEAELKEREKKINELLQAEGSMKSDLERQKRSVMLNKRRYDMLLKEKEELNRVNAALQKQLNEKKGKGSDGDVTIDQALKEKKEKDTRIQILEKTLERFREGKTKLEKIDKSVLEEKTKFVEELEKHKQALENLLLDVEKAKQTANISLDGNASLQVLTGNSLDESASSYLGTCEDLEKLAQSVIDDIGGPSIPTSTATAPTSSGAPVAVSHPSGKIHPVPSTIQPPITTNEERDRRVSVHKPSGESRRPGRRLIRPRLTKQDEAQGDVEMPEVEGTNQASVTDTETRVMSPPIEQAARKRHAASVSQPVELLDVSGDLSDASLPASKKLKGSNAQVESPVEVIPNLECGDIIPAAEEQFDLATDLTQDAIDEGGDVIKDDDDAHAFDDVQAGDLSQLEDSIQVDAAIDPDNVTEETEKQDDTEMGTPDDGQKDEEEVQPLAESDKEEGELDSDGGSVMYNQGSPLMEEVQSEPLDNVSSPTNEGLTSAPEGNDANSLDVTYRGSDGRSVNEVGEGSNMSTDGNDNHQTARETNDVIKSNAGGPVTIPKVDFNTEADATETKQAVKLTPPGSTTINLNERAREMARRRQAGMISTSVPRGRVAVRGRNMRGRSVRGRGQTPPSDQS